MENSIPIQFDAEVQFQRAVQGAIRDALTYTHGEVFAEAFLVDHFAEVQRAIRRRVHGRSAATVAQDANTLNKLYIRP